MAVAGSCTRTTHRSFDGYEVALVWTADASGDMSEGGTTGKAKFTANGYLQGYNTTPDAGAADEYDVTLIDADGKDVLRGQGLNQQQVSDQTYDTKYRNNVLSVDGNYLFFHSENLTLTVANGGNLGSGTIRFKFTRSQP